MKKLMIALAFAGLSTAAFAQSETTQVPTKKYSVETNSFWSNWFITVGGTYNVFYSNQEHNYDLNQGIFKGFRRSLGFDVAIGKWFTPGLGLRTKFNGIWGKAPYMNEQKNSEKYGLLQEQVLFNLSNMLCGYNEDRVWNFIPYVGAGIARNFTHNRYAYVMGGGILNTWKLSKRVNFNLDVYYTAGEADYDGVLGQTYVGAAGEAEGRRGAPGHDKTLTAEVGFTFNLGKTGWSKAPDVDALMALNQAQLDALNASLAEQQAENAKLRDQLANMPKETKTITQTVKEIDAADVSVFFNLASAKMASKKDVVNLKSIAEVSKNNPDAKITVTGYADSKTGNAKFNQTLSEKRAKTVADKLVELGVNRDNIITEAKGGVNDLKPYSYNRRVIVSIK
ncbi:MAG: OmpA family protein [Bacteroidaceae bacterium]|nr:OmpA family protein [Bacteroidaceae bacterium]